MSEQAPEAPAPQRESRRRGGFVSTFTTRIGPLPMWVWLVIVAAILIAWRLYSAKTSATAQTTQDTGTSAEDVPQFVNQTYTTVTPPMAGPPGPPGPPGPAGRGDPSGPPIPVNFQPSLRPPPPSRGRAPGMPTGIKATHATSNAISAAWAKVAGATSYIVRVTYQGKLVKQMTTHSPFATISGLGPDHTYTVHVAAVGPGGTSAESNGPAIKTTR